MNNSFNSFNEQVNWIPATALCNNRRYKPPSDHAELVKWGRHHRNKSNDSNTIKDIQAEAAACNVCAKETLWETVGCRIQHHKGMSFQALWTEGKSDRHISGHSVCISLTHPPLQYFNNIIILLSFRANWSHKPVQILWLLYTQILYCFENQAQPCSAVLLRNSFQLCNISAMSTQRKNAFVYRCIIVNICMWILWTRFIMQRALKAT